MSPDKNVFELCDESRLNMFDKVCGTDKIRKQFEKNFLVEDIKETWTKDEENFRDKAGRYFLY